MCGITGFVAPGPMALGPYLEAHQLLKHRGPDDEGFVAALPMGISAMRSSRTIADYNTLPLIEPHQRATWILGHHRLSIVDLSAAGHQPMSSDDNRLWVVFNGEIYNHVELRTELEGLGLRFRSRSDTEVILRAYQQWGEACFTKFNGMWALALYDTQTHRLLLSRDRLGVKPLYWTLSEDILYFASELKFMRRIQARPQLNQMLATDFLATARSEHHTETLVQGVFSVAAGHNVMYSPGSSGIVHHTYWQLPPIADQADIDYTQARTQLQGLFDSAIDLRMRSDVPVGALLSGGIDSTAIVANLASRKKIDAHGFHSYSSVYDESQYSERGYIESTVKYYPMIQPHYIKPDPLAMMSDLPDLLEAQDGPVRSMAVYAQYCLYRAIAADGHVKVLLNGQGADELFAGYTSYRYPWIADALPNLLLAVSRLRATEPRHTIRSRLQAWRWILSLRLGRERAAVDTPFALSGAPYPAARERGGSLLRQALRQSLQRSALPEYLRYEDRNSMRFGLESRLPFLDYRLVEFAATLPDAWLITHDQSKHILRDAVHDYLTPQVAARRDKTGFLTPQEIWQKNQLHTFMADELAACDFSFVEAGPWHSWLKKYHANFDHPYFAWRAVSLHLWMRQWGF